MRKLHIFLHLLAAFPLTRCEFCPSTGLVHNRHKTTNWLTLSRLSWIKNEIMAVASKPCQKGQNNDLQGIQRHKNEKQEYTLHWKLQAYVALASQPFQTTDWLTLLLLPLTLRTQRARVHLRSFNGFWHVIRQILKKKLYKPFEIAVSMSWDTLKVYKIKKNQYYWQLGRILQ